MGLNLVVVQGKLGQDPEVRYTGGGDAVCKFSMAVTKKYTDKSGTKREQVYWAQIVAWRKLAEICGQYLTKGQECIITGSLTTNAWEKDGVKRRDTEIVASEMSFTAAPATARAKEQEEEEFPF